MKDNKSAECFVCRKHQVLASNTAGIIYQDDLIIVSHAILLGDEETHYLGYIFVEPKRHVWELGDLMDDEAQIIGRFTSRVAKGLMETVGMKHVYSFVFGDGAPHLHVHVIGRYPGTPREYWGTNVDEWPDAPKGDAAEIEEVVLRLRTFLNKQYG
jgi:diadenosine tetraphosphate (Ap4A) HIT family hydrolase